MGEVEDADVVVTKIITPREEEEEEVMEVTMAMVAVRQVPQCLSMAITSLNSKTEQAGTSSRHGKANSRDRKPLLQTGRKRSRRTRRQPTMKRSCFATPRPS